MMLYSWLSHYLPRRSAIVVAAVCYACLVILIYLVADSPEGQFRYISL